MDKIKGQLAGVAALLGVIAAIGGGFVKYGEIMTKLDVLSEQTGPDLTPLAQQIGNNQKMISENIGIANFGILVKRERQPVFTGGFKKLSSLFCA